MNGNAIFTRERVRLFPGGTSTAIPMGNHGDSFQSIDDSARPTAGLSRRLAGRYLFAFATIVGLVIVDQVVIQPLLAKMSRYAPVINVAGRQRMLSQKLAKAALALRAAQDESHRDAERNELRETLATWRTAYAALREGDAAHDIKKIQSDEIRAEWTTLEPHFRAMCAAADQLVRPSDGFDDKQLAAATTTIVDHEAEFLRSMDRIVALMESEAAATVVRLRVSAAAIAAAIILLLVGLGWFVIRPATHVIRSQLDMLESAVAARTRELSSALTALQREVQERETSDRRSQRLAAQLAHAGRVSSLGHLAAGLAHELNQPLATIANYAESCDIELAHIPKDARTDRLTKYFDQAKQAALRAGKIIRRIRNFVRPDAPSAVCAEMESLVCEVAEFCRTEVAHAGAELSLELNDERAVIEVDPIQIQQVLVNLIQNGLQAMREIPIDRRRVEVRSTVFADSVRIEVTDSGPGFATSDLESVFAPFHTTKRDGLGIGLAISRSIVEQHGGTIWAEMPPDGGARVVFVLPLMESHVGSCREPADCVCR
jgi:two-component system, LuxR family, sensor kinase FixL